MKQFVVLKNEEEQEYEALGCRKLMLAYHVGSMRLPCWWLSINYQVQLLNDLWRQVITCHQLSRSFRSQILEQVMAITTPKTYLPRSVSVTSYFINVFTDTFCSLNPHEARTNFSE